MQSLFDISMPAPYSYIVAVLVILGLLAIFAMIVRRVAAHGPYPENSTRGRGPRLGVVDTFDLDKDRQLVIVRRDNVEHLLMIGGTSDVVIETNIVRAIGASGMREQNFANLTSATQSEPTLQSIPVETPPLAPPAPPPPAPLMPPAVTPRLRPQQPAPAPYVPPVQPVRISPEPELSAIPVSAPLPPPPLAARDPEPPLNLAPSQPISSPIEQAAQSRRAVNQNELVALAKRLEASIPSIAPRAEKQAASQVIPNAPLQPAQYVEPHGTEPSGSGISLKPAAPPPSYTPEIDPSRALRQTMAAQTPRPAPAAPVFTPESDMLSDSTAEAQEPFPDMIPMPPPAQPASAPPMAMPPETPKDRQAAALDENLRRLLGRKIEPRS